MRTLYTLFFFCSLSFCNEVNAWVVLQNDTMVKQHSLLLSPGYDQIKEENLHPKVFSGPALTILYNRSVENINIKEWQAGIHLSGLTTKLESFPKAAAAEVQAGYTYLFRLNDIDPIKFYIGPLFDLKYGTRAFFSWDESHLYYANHLAGAVAGRLNYRMGTNSLSISLDIPIISVISRPILNRQYKIDNMRTILSGLAKNRELALPDRNFYIRANAEYKYVSKNLRNRSISAGFIFHSMKASGGNRSKYLGYNLTYKFFL